MGIRQFCWRDSPALKSLHQLASFGDRGLAVQDQARPPEDTGQVIGHRRGNLAEWREDQRLFLPLREFLANLSEARELPTIVGRIIAVAGPLRRVVANLFQPHQRRKNDAAALDSVSPPTAAANSRIACS